MLNQKAPVWCQSCGGKLVDGLCPECDRRSSGAPRAAPAAAYGAAAPRSAEGPPERRRTSSEWLTPPSDDAPATRRAHPTQVRLALAEAEAKARAKAEAQAARELLAASVTASPAPAPRPRAGAPVADGEVRRTTAPRLKLVTPLPPDAPLIVDATAPPDDAIAPPPVAAPVDVSPSAEAHERPAAATPTGTASRLRGPLPLLRWLLLGLAVGACGAALALALR